MTGRAASFSITLTTAPNPGAVAIIQLRGPGVIDMLKRLTGRSAWPAGHVRYVPLADIDHGCAVLLRQPPDPWAQVMPHGGPRVVQKLLDWFIEDGGRFDPEAPARDIYPEARSDLEADMLATIARAASPAAVDLLLAQPPLWQSALQGPLDFDQISRQSATLDQLIEPPSVVVIGPANVGKSTLTNRLMGRTASVVADLPGTTRDWVGGLIELSPYATCRHVGDTVDGDQSQVSYDLHTVVAVRWLDTPGLRQSHDAIEQQAIGLARRVIVDADVLIAMRDEASSWPDEDLLPRAADLWVVNKIDDGRPLGDGRQVSSPLAISALHDVGIDALQACVLQWLGLADVHPPQLWAFSPTLRDAVPQGRTSALAAYVSADAPPT